MQSAEPVIQDLVVRRRPPDGIESHNCGGFQFKVDDDQLALKPANILEEIVWYKDVEIKQFREEMPLANLAMMVKSAEPPRDFVGSLRRTFEETGSPALIAEVKKASPSKGVIRADFDAVAIARAYEKGGATCLSVLTDKKFFQGGFENLLRIRNSGVSTPLLCKEFIVEAYQLYLARARGADAALLIAAVLPNKDIAYLLKIMKQLGLHCILEVHSVGELERVLELGPEVLDSSRVALGINNRDLQTFKVELDNTNVLLSGDRKAEVERLGLLTVGESGIFTPDDVKFLYDSAGIGAILVGESLVKQEDIEAATKALLQR